MKEKLDLLVLSIRNEILKGNFTLKNVKMSFLDDYDLQASLLLDGLTLEFHASKFGLVYQTTSPGCHHIKVLEYLEDSYVSKAIHNAFKPHFIDTNLSRIAYLESELNKLKQI